MACVGLLFLLTGLVPSRVLSRSWIDTIWFVMNLSIFVFFWWKCMIILKLSKCCLECKSSACRCSDWYLFFLFSLTVGEEEIFFPPLFGSSAPAFPTQKGDAGKSSRFLHSFTSTDVRRKSLAYFFICLHFPPCTGPAIPGAVNTQTNAFSVWVVMCCFLSF